MGTASWRVLLTTWWEAGDAGPVPRYILQFSGVGPKGHGPLALSDTPTRACDARGTQVCALSLQPLVLSLVAMLWRPVRRRRAKLEAAVEEGGGR